MSEGAGAGGAGDASGAGGASGASRIVVREGPDLAVELAAWLARAIGAAVAARGRCALALPGGKSPAPVLRRLGAGSLRPPVDWSRVEVFFGDERAVPPGDPDSNYRMVAEALLGAVRPAAVYRMEGERADLDAAADAYARLLPDRLDVLVLGMGPDGHTASLFPGSAALAERVRRVVAVRDAPKPPPRRLTITPPVIEASREIAVLATGAEKAAAVAQAHRPGTAARDVPVRLAARGVWFLDPAAAARLARQS